jgi:hypothetical protein
LPGWPSLPISSTDPSGLFGASSMTGKHTTHYAKTILPF